MNAFDALLEALEQHGSKVKHAGHGKASAQCPAHDDGNPSLSIGTRHDGKGAVVHCQAGCDTSEVVSSLGWKLADLFDDDGLRTAYAEKAAYQYPGGRINERLGIGADGKKKFKQTNSQDHSLFGANTIGAEGVVYVCEGEKAALAIRGVGALAVAAGGANRESDWSPLKSRHVVLVADRDKPGQKWAERAYFDLRAIAASVLVVQAAVNQEHADAADHIAADLALEAFEPVNVGADVPRVWRAKDLKPAKQAEWLGKGWLMRAATAILVGEEGIGKSLWWVRVVAAVTTGKPLPECGIPAREPSMVVIVVTEDDWQTTVLPRLQVVGADLDMIRVICTDDDGSGSPVFPRDFDLLATMEPKPALVVVDAWLDTVPPGLVVRDPQGARQALHPCKEVATRTGAAMLLLTHTNRLSTGNARDRYGITAELRKKARLTIYAQRNEDGNLVIGPEKANSVAIAPAAVYDIKSVQHFEPNEDDDGTVGALSFVETSDRTSGQHLADAFDAEQGEDRQDRSAAISWLRQYIEFNGPGVLSAEAKREGEKAGFSGRTLQRARQELGVIYGWTSAQPPKTTWSLPVQPANSIESIGAGEASSGDQLCQAASVSGGTAGTADETAGQPAVPGSAGGTAGGTPETPDLSSGNDADGPSYATVTQIHGGPGTAGGFDASPPCFYCDKPVTSKQQDSLGRYAHLSCQQDHGGLA